MAYTQLAMAKATEADIRHLEENFQAFERKYQARSLTTDDDLEFHKIILNSTHNPFIIKIGATVFEFLRESVEHSLACFTEQTLENHRHILAALKNRDEAAMNSAMDDMFRTFYQSLSKPELSVQPAEE